MNALRSLISVCMVFEMLFGSKEYFVSEPEDFMEDASLSRAALNPGAGCRIGNQHDIHTAYLFINADRPDRYRRA